MFMSNKNMQKHNNQQAFSEFKTGIVISSRLGNAQ